MNPTAHPEPLVWTAHPVKERPLVGGLVVAIIGFFSWLAGLWMGHWVMSLFATAFLFCSLSAYFLPMQYRIDENGITAQRGSRYRRFLKWDRIRRFEHHARCGMVSPQSKGWLIPSLSAIKLIFPSSPASYVQRIEQYLQAHRNAGRNSEVTAKCSAVPEEVPCGNG